MDDHLSTLGAAREEERSGRSPLPTTQAAGFLRAIRQRLDSLSIFWKIALPTAALVLLSGAVTVCIVYFMTIAALDAEMHSNVMARSMSLGREVDYLLSSADPGALDRLHALLAEPVERPTRLYAFVEDASAEVLYAHGDVAPEFVEAIHASHAGGGASQGMHMPAHTGGETGQPMDMPAGGGMGQPMQMPARAGDGAGQPMDMPTRAGGRMAGHGMTTLRLEDGPTIMDVMVPLAAGRILHTGHTLGQMREITDSLIFPLLGVISIAPFVSLTVMFLLMRSVTAPLRKLTAVVSEIGRGVLDRPVSVSGTREIATLASTLERMRFELRGLYSELERRVEERTAEAERLSRQNELVLNAAGGGIYGLDVQGNTTFVNPAAARMTGWEVADLIGQPEHAILHCSKPDGTPYPRETCPIYAAFKDGAVHHVDTEVFWRKDGTSFPVEYTSPYSGRAR